MLIKKLVSGGQTGVDRAALDVALELGLPCGGWCPKGRLAEDGLIPRHYPLEEATTPDYPQRTEWNVRDSDATLVLTQGAPEGGTELTILLARKHRRPCLLVDLNESPDPQAVVKWLAQNPIATLNVAGPRASKAPEVYAKAATFLRELFRDQTR